MAAHIRSMSGGIPDGPGLRTTVRQAPLQIFTGHKDEGFALDWSPITAGRLLSGQPFSFNFKGPNRLRLLTQQFLDCSWQFYLPYFTIRVSGLHNHVLVCYRGLQECDSFMGTYNRWQMDSS